MGNNDEREDAQSNYCGTGKIIINRERQSIEVTLQKNRDIRVVYVSGTTQK